MLNVYWPACVPPVRRAMNVPATNSENEHWLSVTYHPPGDNMELFIDSMEVIKIPKKLSLYSAIAIIEEAFYTLERKRGSVLHKCKLIKIHVVEGIKMQYRKKGDFTKAYKEMIEELYNKYRNILCPKWRTIDDE